MANAREQSKGLGDPLLLEADDNDCGRRDLLRLSVDSDLEDPWAIVGSMESKKKCVTT